jgi:transcriptional regulator with XRE-family HTH domain
MGRQPTTSARKLALRAREIEVEERVARAINAAVEADPRLAVEIVDAIGFDQGQLSKYRKGVTVPGIGRVYLLARELGIPVGRLFEEPATKPEELREGADLSLLQAESPRKERRQSARRSHGAG